MTIKNRLLQIASFFTSIFCGKKRFQIPEGYKIVHCDTFEKIKIGDYWIDWGDRGYLQTNDLTAYWNNHDAMKVENHELVMWVEHKPLTWTMEQLPEYQRREMNFHEIDGNPIPRVIDLFTQKDIDFATQNDIVSIPFVRGRLCSKNGYKYGIFKVDVMLPKGFNLHPSFWLSGIESWPPEIDMFEYYTKKNSIEPNVHYGDSHENHMNTRATNISMKHKHDEWHEIIGWWEKDFIKIYYDGRLVYEVTDKNVLKWFDKEQRIILTCSIDEWGVHEFTNKPTKQPVKYRNLEIYQK